jgi:hypothetical protein
MANDEMKGQLMEKIHAMDKEFSVKLAVAVATVGTILTVLKLVFKI